MCSIVGDYGLSINVRYQKTFQQQTKNLEWWFSRKCPSAFYPESWTLHGWKSAENLFKNQFYFDFNFKFEFLLWRNKWTKIQLERSDIFGSQWTLVNFCDSCLKCGSEAGQCRIFKYDLAMIVGDEYKVDCTNVLKRDDDKQKKLIFHIFQRHTPLQVPSWLHGLGYLCCSSLR